MKLINQMNWFEQSVVKLELAQAYIDELKDKLYIRQKSLAAQDQVKIVTITTLLRSPIDYALGAVYKKYSLKEKSIWPRYNDEKSFKENFSKLTGCENEEIIERFLRLKIPSYPQTHWFNLLNDLSNNEKHNFITPSNKYTRYRKTTFHENGVAFSSNFVASAGSEHMVPFIEQLTGVNFSPNSKISTTYLFDINIDEHSNLNEFTNMDAFDLLYIFLENVNEFIIDVFEILEPDAYIKYVNTA